MKNKKSPKKTKSHSIQAYDITSLSQRQSMT